MSESATPKSHAPGMAGGKLSDGLNAASPRQVARLRFLGVRFQEPLSLGQAGALIERTNADPDFATKIQEWHAKKFALHPALYPPSHTAVIVPDRQDSNAQFRLPVRGPDEINATVFQKRRLEQFGGCDFPVIDTLGREQAAALIKFLEAESVARSREFLFAQLEARAQEAAQAAAAQPPAQGRARSSQRLARLGWIRWVLLGVAAAGLAFFFLHRAPVAPQENEAPSPAAATDPAALEAARFKQAVAASQSQALKRYPALGVGGSRFNMAFVARYRQLSQQHSPRLNAPDWPEKLADECAAKLPAAYY